jgi:hypothetical protein
MAEPDLSFIASQIDCVFDELRHIRELLGAPARPMKYRPHRGSLADAMAAVVELPDRAALIAHLAAELRPWGYMVEDADVRVEPYGFDARIGWETYIVTVRNKRLVETIGDRWFFGAQWGPDYFGAVGFTDGPA